MEQVKLLLGPYHTSSHSETELTPYSLEIRVLTDYLFGSVIGVREETTCTYIVALT